MNKFFFFLITILFINSNIGAQNCIQPDLSFIKDTTLCEEEATLLLNVACKGCLYMWQDRSTDSTFLINATGAYQVEVLSPCGAVAKKKFTVTYGNCYPFFVPNISRPMMINIMILFISILLKMYLKL